MTALRDAQIPQESRTHHSVCVGVGAQGGLCTEARGQRHMSSQEYFSTGLVLSH